VSVAEWRPVGNVEAEKLGEARRQAHNAAQWLARMTHSYMPHADDGGHLLLHWDSQRDTLVTQEFLPDLTLELRLFPFELQFREGGRPAPHVLDLDDRTPAEVEAWVLVELLHRRLDRDRFSKHLPYEIPNLMVGDAVPYVSEGLDAEFAELAGWFSNAASVLTNLVADTDAVAPMCVWPESFHMAAVLPVHAAKSKATKQLRAGFSAGEADGGEPCFYLAPHNANGTVKVAGALTASQLRSAAEPARHALEYLRKCLTAERDLATKPSRT
jgi:hypothetical protein